MEMPPSFATVLKGMATDELKELLEWNIQSKSNYHAVKAIKAEIESRAE